MTVLPEPLISPVVDTHCHMDVSFDDDHSLANVDTALAQAAAVGVSHVIQVGCDVASSEWAADAAARYDNVWATVALHPNDTARDANLSQSLERIAELAELPHVRGIGETGLDYFRTKPDKHHIQQDAFRTHLDIARAVGKPVIIHDREAHDDVIDILLTHPGPDTVVFHSYSGDADMARVCADNGWYMSISGVVTFNNAQSLRDAVAVMPDELILVETDAPFLTPAPHRGQPNSSALMIHTVRAISAVREQSEADVCKFLFSNAARVFGPF